MDWKKNDIRKIHEYIKKQTILGILIVLSLPQIGIIYLMINRLSLRGFLIGEGIVLPLGLLAGLYWWFSQKKHPQFIKLNDKGINIKDFRGKERIIPWEKISTIYSLDDIYSSSRLGPSDVTGYAIYYKRKFSLSEYILVDKEIGDKIKRKIGMKETKYNGML